MRDNIEKVFVKTISFFKDDFCINKNLICKFPGLFIIKWYEGILLSLFIIPFSDNDPERREG